VNESSGRQGLWAIPGDGVLARQGDLVLLSTIDERGLLDKLLGLLAETSGSGGDGRRFADAVEGLIESDETWGGARGGQPVPAIITVGPAAAGLAVAVSGTAWAEVITGYGTDRLAAGQPSTVLRYVVGVPVHAIRGGLGTGHGDGGRTDRFSRLERGTVRAGGLSYHLRLPAAPGAAPAGAPAAGTPAASAAAAEAAAGAAYGAGGPPGHDAAAPDAAGPGAGAAEAAGFDLAGAGAAGPDLAGADLAGADLAGADLAGADLAATDPAGAGEQSGPAAPAVLPAEAEPPAAQPSPEGPPAGQPYLAEPAAQPRPEEAGPPYLAESPAAQPPAAAQPYLAEPLAAEPGLAEADLPAADLPAAGLAAADLAESGPAQAGPTEADPQAALAETDVEGPAAVAAAELPPAPPAVAARPARPPTEMAQIPDFAAGPAAPPPAAAVPVREPTGPANVPPGPPADAPGDAAAGAGPGAFGAAIVLGVYCKNGHFGDPDARSCAVCGAARNRRGQVPQPGPRPPLGALLLDDGSAVELTADCVIGREPGLDPSVVAGEAQPLRIVDPEMAVSRIHARVHLDGWQVFLIDLGSANGTRVLLPGKRSDQALQPNVPVPLQSGTRVIVGTSGFRFEQQRGR
jgi:hypothetical protein